MFLKRGNTHKRRQREFLEPWKPERSAVLTWLLRVFSVTLLIVVTLLLLSISKLAAASEDSDSFPRVNMDAVSEGSLLLKSDTPGVYQQVPLVNTDVDIKISGMILRSHVKQTFNNTSNEWVEGVSVFPLPELAAVDHMRMQVGERVLEGLIQEKQQARKTYEMAKQQGKKAALTEQQRPNLFTNSVANIGPGETVVVEIEYQQLLHYEQGEFSFHFPMAITPRYIPGKPIKENISLNSSGWAPDTDQVPDASKITPPVYTGPGSVNPVTLHIDLDAGFPLQAIASPYHDISQKALNDGHTIIQLKENSIASDRDFKLVWQPQLGQAPRAAVFNETRINKTGIDETEANDEYHLLMLMPPDDKSFGSQPLAREVIYVIDTSGSMGGTSIEQAKQALLMALEQLRVHDRFNVIQFNSTTQNLFVSPQMASDANIATAQQYVQNLVANGGTEMAPALKQALQDQQDNTAIRQVVFLTDGSVGNESTLFNLIHQNLGNSRLFTVGIGSAPNHYFMRKAAQFGRGSFTYIGKVSEVKHNMEKLFSKLESAVMTNIHVQYEDGVAVETWPQRIPDLYTGEPLVLAIRSSGALKNITVSGTRALAPWTANLDLTTSGESPGIGVYWARSKIAALMDSVHEGASQDQVRTDIIKVALTHHLVSKYTSLVAVDVTPTRPDKATLAQKSIPVNLPHGQQYEKIFGRLPQTATPAELQLITGLMLLLLAGITGMYMRRTRQ